MRDDPDMAFQTLRVETSGRVGRLTLDPTGGSFADAALTAAAIQEPESMEATARYMARRTARGKP